MNNGEKKHYLKRYLVIKRRVELLTEQIQELRNSQTSIMGLGDGMPKGNKKTDLSGYAAEFDILINKLEAEQQKQDIVYHEILQAIDLIEDVNEQEILTRHYLLDQNWREIEEKMKYSYGHILKIHGKALQNFSIK